VIVLDINFPVRNFSLVAFVMHNFYFLGVYSTHTTPPHPHPTPHPTPMHKYEFVFGQEQDLIRSF
jgi:hypothetical protein